MLMHIPAHHNNHRRRRVHHLKKIVHHRRLPVVARGLEARLGIGALHRHVAGPHRREDLTMLPS